MCGFTPDDCHAKSVNLHWTPAMPKVWIHTRHLPCQICGFWLDVWHDRCVDSHLMLALPNVCIHTGRLPCQVCGFTLNACHARCVNSHVIYPMNCDRVTQRSPPPHKIALCVSFTNVRQPKLPPQNWESAKMIIFKHFKQMGQAVTADNYFTWCVLLL